MPGCFGRRKKKKNKDQKADGSKGSAPEPKPNSHRSGNDVAAAGAPAGGPPAVRQHVTPQTHAAPGASPQKQPPTIDEPEVAEVITVTRSQSVHNTPPKPGNIKKAATMSRYDFLRKQDNINYADRWAALRQRYLEQKMENGEAGGGDGLLSPAAAQNGGSPKSKRKVQALSLPRQFAPLSPPPHSPVTFSGWFYERQAREQEARREFHDREERMRKIIDGPSKDDMEEAAVKIQAGYKGYRTRKDLQAKKEDDDKEQKPADAAAPEESQPQEPDVAAAEEGEAAAPAAAEAAETEDIDLNDPELAQAATRIQAGFKGYQTRKKLKEETEQPQQQEKQTEEQPESEEQKESPEAAETEAAAAAEGTESSEDPSHDQAASKIQAGFRGMRARREVAEMRKQRAGDEAAPEEAEAKAEAEGEVEAKAEDEEEPEAEGGEAAPQEEAKAEDEGDADVEAAAVADEAAEPAAATEPEPEAEAEEAAAGADATEKPEEEAAAPEVAAPEADEAEPTAADAAAAPSGEEQAEEEKPPAEEAADAEEGGDQEAS